MSSIFYNVANKSKLYEVDEYGVVNYKTGFIACLCIFVMAILTCLFGSITYYAEYGATNATITSFSDALWLMVMSSTTIGFGDHYPVTLLGRTMVTMMFIFGVGIIGGLGALIASRLLGFSDTNVKNRELRLQNNFIIEQNKQVLAQIAALEQQLKQKK